MPYIPYNQRNARPNPDTLDLGLDAQEETPPAPSEEPLAEEKKPISTSSFYSEKYKTVNYINALKKDLPPQAIAERINNMEKEIYFAQQRILEGETMANNPIATPQAYPPQTGSYRSRRKKRKNHKLLFLIITGLGLGLLTILLLVLGYGLYCYLTNRDGNMGVIMPTLIYCLGIAVGCSFVSHIVRQRSLIPALLVAGSFLLISLVLSLIYANPADFKVGYILIKLVISLVASVGGFLLSVIPHWLLTGKKRKKRQRVRSA